MPWYDWDAKICRNLRDRIEKGAMNGAIGTLIPELRRLEGIGSGRSGCAALVAMMKPAYFGNLNDPAPIG